MRRGILTAFAAFLLGAVPAAATPLQPGALVGNYCTLSFVYDGLGPVAGRVFIGTAAHCVHDRLDEPITDSAGIPFGRVALLGDADADDGFTRPLDFALIEVDRAHHARVDPSMAGHPDMPTRVATEADVRFGDMLQMSGWGIGYAATQTTREQRQAVLTAFGGGMFEAIAPVIGGDSGGPLAHIETGAALGTVSGLDTGTLGTLNGPTVENIIAVAAHRGLPILMRAAGEPAPPPPAPAGSPPAEPKAEPEPKARPKPKAKRKKCGKGKRRVRGKCRKTRTRRR